MEYELEQFCFDDKMKEYATISMSIFKARLYDMYSAQKERKRYEMHDLKWHSEKFAKYDFPIAYDYSTHSILSSMNELFEDVPKVLLREHWISFLFLYNEYKGIYLTRVK